MDNDRLAQEALACYDLRVARIIPIAQSGGAVFRVEDVAGRAYTLRVHLPKSTTLEPLWARCDVLASELLWLEALGRDTDLILPAPLRNRAGDYVTPVNGVNCTLLTWVEGEQKPYFTNEAELRAVAEMTATLHRQASGWRPPADFVRPRHDEARVRHALDLLRVRGALCGLAGDDVAVLCAAGAKAAAMMAVLPRTALTWGLLHMDLLPANILYVGGRACPIDFGACGYGYLLNDLASTFCFVTPAARRQYIAWYGAGFPLPDGYVQQIEGLFVAAQLTAMIHFLGLPDAPDWLPGQAQRLAAREFRRYLDGEGFLFSGTPFWE
jgi:Ser/Thr protein kinase RdoA (MazF antagonist)